MLPHRSRDQGFSLIELLVVVAVIGVLAAIAVPSFLAVQGSSKDAALQSDLTHAKVATVGWAGTKDTVALPAIDTQLTSLGYAPSTYAGSGVAPAYRSGSTAELFCIVGTSDSGQQWSITTHGAARKGACPAPAGW